MKVSELNRMAQRINRMGHRDDNQSVNYNEPRSFYNSLLAPIDDDEDDDDASIDMHMQSTRRLPSNDNIPSLSSLPTFEPSRMNVNFMTPAMTISSTPNPAGQSLTTTSNALLSTTTTHFPNPPLNNNNIASSSVSSGSAINSLPNLVGSTINGNVITTHSQPNPVETNTPMPMQYQPMTMTINHNNQSMLNNRNNQSMLNNRNVTQSTFAANNAVNAANNAANAANALKAAELRTQQEFRDYFWHQYQHGNNMQFPQKTLLSADNHEEQFLEIAKYTEVLTPEQKHWKIPNFKEKRGDVFSCGKPRYDKGEWESMYAKYYCDHYVDPVHEVDDKVSYTQNEQKCDCKLQIMEANSTYEMNQNGTIIYTEDHTIEQLQSKGDEKSIDIQDLIDNCNADWNADDAKDPVVPYLPESASDKEKVNAIADCYFKTWRNADANPGTTTHYVCFTFNLS